MKEINNIRIDKDFLLKEFECPCCKCVMIHPDLLKLLILLRKEIKSPIYINSGYRCKSFNDQVGGTPKSYHTFGMAADIHSRNVNISDLAVYAKLVGFKGIGVYKNFIHLDVRPYDHHWEG